MATLGLLSPEFPSSTLEANLNAMAAAGATGVQLDLVNAVGDTFPENLTDTQIAAIKDGFAANRLVLSALSGTYNMIDPDPVKRAKGAQALDRLIALAPKLGTRVVTLCTGSRDPDDMWRRHEASDSPEAWQDLLVTTRQAVRTAEDHGIFLGVETEVGNSINTVRKARRLLDEVGSPSLKIIMDGANIFQKGELPRMREKLDEAFELLGADIVLAHAKDLDRDGEAGHVPAGLGRLDYPYYLKKMQESGYQGSIILHALKPEQAVDRLAFVSNAAPPGYLKSR
ncbi:sugar phosphate isomerase/epimerase family protein [Rhizobium sp. AG207R]|uniref:sugar phosphate isomerase/epimerase family protein n=1 Tax=Rhizobium sp. AG207R TaxID=2802287 RepID=UPI0022AC5D72|nr:sugar phosphate isomerase/epimerase family protein [Rhizobium sp. AG207R]MCZ3374346.1 sugar phosphate isomerase/epimerase [Rhizobium sp. AG207R]